MTRRPKPRTLRTDLLGQAELADADDAHGRPTLDRLDPRLVRGRYRAERLTARQARAAARLLALLRRLDRAGAPDAVLAAAAGVPVSVIREWRYGPQ